MKITIYPYIRDQFTMGAMADTMKANIIELHGSEDKARTAHDEWAKYHPPIHHWTTYLNIARIVTYMDLLPSERKMMTEKIEWEIK